MSPVKEYLPAGYDLIIRRALCFAFLGRAREAESEVTRALNAIPHAPSALLLQGMLLTRRFNFSASYKAFNECCKCDNDLSEAVALAQAALAVARGDYDLAIRMATDVLGTARSCSVSVHALLVRGNAYKEHCNPTLQGHAHEDFGKAKNLDPTVEEFVGCGFHGPNTWVIERMMLRFHPWLRDQA